MCKHYRNGVTLMSYEHRPKASMEEMIENAKRIRSEIMGLAIEYSNHNNDLYFHSNMDYISLNMDRQRIKEMIRTSRVRREDLTLIWENFDAANDCIKRDIEQSRARLRDSKIRL